MSLSWMPCLVRSANGAGTVSVAVGHELVDAYLRFVAARARPNTVLAVGFDLKVFFSVVAKEPAAVTTADVLGFIEAQRRPRRGNVVRIEDGEVGLSARTIKRRLSSVAGLFDYLIATGASERSPVPRRLATRRPNSAGRGVALVRAPRTLPRVLEPAEVDSLMTTLRTRRDRAMAEAMLLGGLRRCEVLGLRLGDLNLGEKRVFVAEGKGGHQRIVPVSSRFPRHRRRVPRARASPDLQTDRLFVVLKGQRRGQPLSAAGVDEIFRAARRRSGLAHLTCHELRHTCLTRLREAGMALEAVQAQAGHRSIESTRIYLHLANGWLSAEYERSMQALDADQAQR